MKLMLNPAWEHLHGWLARLPETFAAGGETLHDGRNTIRAFEVAGVRLAVKRYKRPNLFNTFIYSFLRKSKARRGYEHALRLRQLGFDTPEPVAWCECRRRWLLRDAYLVTLRSDCRALSEVTSRFPARDTLPVLEAFAAFAARMHERGIVHEDFNQGNVLWTYDAAAERYRFQLIDINRMRFRQERLRPRDCMVNLRRLACPAGAFLYILDRYAEHRSWNIDDTLLRGTFFRLVFSRRRQIRKRFRHRMHPADRHRNAA